MNKPVDKTEFWKDRLAKAKLNGRLHYSVYISNDKLWNRIEENHKTILKREVGPKAKVLDAGCGYGRMSEYLQNYTGVDFSPDLLAEAKKLHPDKKFIEADLTNLPFKDAQFDVAFCISIKGMIEDNLGSEVWEKMESELKRVANKVLILEYEDSERYIIL